MGNGRRREEGGKSTTGNNPVGNGIPAGQLVFQATAGEELPPKKQAKETKQKQRHSRATSRGVWQLARRKRPRRERAGRRCSSFTQPLLAREGPSDDRANKRHRGESTEKSRQKQKQNKSRVLERPFWRAVSRMVLNGAGVVNGAFGPRRDSA
ncbi:hypothetical protein HPB48_023865 [Haemaphysalis longicornis]|uniref:Uncharacterized protein n=1 Tax=Haemaphysalis longicornis TaxID=44386 RepID=A0A9J6H7V1_HAELO|nr:hypothetical protein HPB48_023865 [Haemaphysalis longicornis]